MFNQGLVRLNDVGGKNAASSKLTNIRFSQVFKAVFTSLKINRRMPKCNTASQT